RRKRECPYRRRPLKSQGPNLEGRFAATDFAPRTSRKLKRAVWTSRSSVDRIATGGIDFFSGLVDLQHFGPVDSEAKLVQFNFAGLAGSLVAFTHGARPGSSAGACFVATRGRARAVRRARGR